MMSTEARLSPAMASVLIVLSKNSCAEAAVDIGRASVPRISKIAAVSVLRALERRGAVLRIPPCDQWGSAFWTISKAGRQVVSKLEGA